MKKKLHYFIYRFFLFIAIFLNISYVFFAHPPEADSGNLTSATDTLSNPRLSFFGRNDGNLNIGDTNITVKTTSDIPDKNVEHLFPKDTIAIGNAGNLTVASISAGVAPRLTFSLTSGLPIPIADNQPIYSTQSAIHTINFTNQSSVANGAIRVLIPAGSNTTSSNDGAPDGGATAGFDFNSITSANITCPTGGGVDAWEMPTATPSSVLGTNWHAFECRYRGTLNASQNLTMIIGNSTKKLINPAPRADHTQGKADSYNIKIQLLSTVYNPVDDIIITVSPIEAVLVSATVVPSLTFQIQGVDNNTSHCGLTPGKDIIVSTTATTVPFGEINSNAVFYNAVQSITASTNAPAGYTIKVAQDDELSQSTVNYIPNTTCDSTTCTHDTSDSTKKGLWDTNTVYGFGYSLENSSSTLDFNYNDTDNGCSGGGNDHFCAHQFACNNSDNCISTNPEQRIARSSGPAANETFYICYRLNVGPTQPAGYYQTRILYYASGNF